ncbi:CHAT domain-containing protein [bacterium]|nr:CHAT domain-containing protein [bacterium]
MAEEKIKAGNYRGAAFHYREALEMAQQSGGGEEKVHCLSRLGVLYWNMGDIQKSTDYYRKALVQAREAHLRKEKNRIETILNIHEAYTQGKELRSSGETQKSIRTFQKAVRKSREIKSKHHEIKCLRQLSVHYWKVFDLQTFSSLNEEALRLARSVNNRREMGKCLNNMGLYHWKCSDYSQALSCYQEALGIARGQQDKKDEANFLNNIALIYKELGCYEKSLDYLREALRIDRQLGSEINVAKDLNNIGINYRLKGLSMSKKNYLKKSLDYYKKSLKLIEDKENLLKVKLLNNIGNLHIFLKNKIISLEYFQKAFQNARKIQDKGIKGMLLNNLGNVHLQLNHLGKAEKFFTQAIELAQEIKGENILWEAYYGLGQCYQQMNHTSLAVSNYKRAVSVVESVSSRIFFDVYKAGFVRNKVKVYEQWLNLLFEQYSQNPSPELMEEIFRIMEKAKARAFLENLSESRVDLFEKLKPELQKRERKLSTRISSLTHTLADPSVEKKERKEVLRELSHLEDEYLRLIREMKAESPEMADMILSQPFSLDEIQQKLPDRKTVILEYFLGEKQSYVFLISSQKCRLFALPSRKEVRRSIKAYLKVLSDPPRRGFSGLLAAQRLYKEFLFPFQDLNSKEVSHLVIIPDGVLYYLPFETLIPPGIQEPSFSDCLVSRHKISYAPSSSSLRLLLKRGSRVPPPRALVAFGNPCYSSISSSKEKKKTSPSQILKELYQKKGFDISPLPYTKKEIKKISRYFPEKATRIFGDKEVREKVVKSFPLHRYKVIHFACHGLLDEEFPFRSALVLSLHDQKGNDGFLQVREIWNLKMKAELVVLSACQTGRGKLEKGEGLLGLARVFFYSGAQSVVCTLWKIGDKPTSRFMNFFYKFLKKGKDKAEALRLAKLEMMKTQYAHPFFWASFVLNGEGDSRIF